MSAEPLAISNPKEGKNHHALFNKVDVARNRPVKELASQTLTYPQQHDKEDCKCGYAVKKILNDREPSIKGRQRRP